MELNKTEEMAVQTSRMIRKLFGDKMSGSVIYDVIDESNHHTFKLKFTVYNFAGVKFQYDNDFFEIYVFSMVMRVYCCLRKIVGTAK